MFASAQTHCRVYGDAIFTARTWFLPRPRVNADADVRTKRSSGRTFSSKNVRYDIPSGQGQTPPSARPHPRPSPALGQPRPCPGPAGPAQAWPRMPGPAPALPWAGGANPRPAPALGNLTPRTSVGLSRHAPWERGFCV
jgi:hypothetical protein